MRSRASTKNRLARSLRSMPNVPTSQPRNGRSMHGLTPRGSKACRCSSRSSACSRRVTSKARATQPAGKRRGAQDQHYAAVEAVRAGAEGRGFAVVASEVPMLAQRICREGNQGTYRREQRRGTASRCGRHDDLQHRRSIAARHAHHGSDAPGMPCADAADRRSYVA
jgi:hypothetical protein